MLSDILNYDYFNLLKFNTKNITTIDNIIPQTVQIYCIGILAF